MQAQPGPGGLVMLFLIILIIILPILLGTIQAAVRRRQARGRSAARPDVPGTPEIRAPEYRALETGTAEARAPLISRPQSPAAVVPAVSLASRLSAPPRPVRTVRRRRIDRLPPLKRALVWSEVLGPPKALRREPDR